MGGRLPLHVGTQGKDHLRGTFLTHPFEKFCDAQLLRPDPVERGELSAKGMVSAPEDSRPLERQDVGGGLHDAELTSRTRLVAAEGTLSRLSEESAQTAGPQRFAGRGDRGDELIRLGIRGSKHPEGDPFGAPRTDPGKTSKLADQFAEGIGIIERGHRE